ncbi:MAG: prolipoprotein diacylglyceryl transferase [Pseudomonadota bacterium]|jgi:phosphatidylglycerol:prolipoprotein diacylglycerol transferase|nr:prolipoprotein diacylglyceryl transferase [Pseudomonadota bacterium]MED5422733.1 prolipoprotein diacylglyceryl transferase [Pseudomonadota bacterium]
MIINFPDIDPVAFSVFGLDVRWYALAYLTGFILGWQYIVYLSKHWHVSAVFTKDVIDDFLVWAVVGVVLGGRVGYVLFYNLPYYADNPIQALQIWQGGMSFHGGLLGMSAAMLIFAKLKKLSVLRLADFVACAAPIGLFFGRMANFINGELYGRPTGADWGMIFGFVDNQPRHPSQLYEAGLEGLVLFVILFMLARLKTVQKIPGLLAAAFLAGYGIFRFLVEYVRQPDAQLGLYWDMLSMGQILSASMVVAAIVLAIFCKARA